jgi:hypothetical protein
MIDFYESSYSLSSGSSPIPAIELDPDQSISRNGRGGQIKSVGYASDYQDISTTEHLEAHH